MTQLFNKNFPPACSLCHARFLPDCRKVADLTFMVHMQDFKKSRIPETKHLSTDADSSTDTTVGWIMNTQKSNFFFKLKKSSKTQKLKNS